MSEINVSNPNSGKRRESQRIYTEKDLSSNNKIKVHKCKSTRSMERENRQNREALNGAWLGERGRPPLIEIKWNCSSVKVPLSETPFAL